MCKKLLVFTKSCWSRTDGPALVVNTGTTIYLEVKTYISIKILFYQFGNFLEPLLLTRINFKLSMDD